MLVSKSLRVIISNLHEENVFILLDALIKESNEVAGFEPALDL